MPRPRPCSPEGTLQGRQVPRPCGAVSLPSKGDVKGSTASRGALFPRFCLRWERPWGAAGCRGGRARAAHVRVPPEQPGPPRLQEGAYPLGQGCSLLLLLPVQGFSDAALCAKRLKDVTSRRPLSRCRTQARALPGHVGAEARRPQSRVPGCPAEP